MIKKAMMCAVTVFNKIKYQLKLINFLKNQIYKNILM
jgi:hypothetical protein